MGHPAATQAMLDKKLIDAAIADDPALARSLLAKGASAKATGPDGYTALMWAARYDLPRVVEALLERSDLDQLCPEGRDALAIAQEGAGPGTLSACYIRTYQAALLELAALAAEVQESRKSKPRGYRI